MTRHRRIKGAGAVTLRANLHTLDALTPDERHLMAERLDRIAAPHRPSRRYRPISASRLILPEVHLEFAREFKRPAPG